MNKIQIANILLTRRCNLSCSYCNIVKNYPGKPSKYPGMKYYAKNELSWKKWIDIFKSIQTNNPDVFFILYGGEPFMYADLLPLLKEMHLLSMNYTVITNNTDHVQTKLLKIAESLGQFKGLTSSVDPLIMDKTIQHTDRAQKSRDGLVRLSKLKKDGVADDVVAEITADSENIPHLYDTVKLLSESDIWSSITAIDKQKTEYYDFSSVSDSTMLLEEGEEVWDQFTKIMHDDNLKVHIPDLLSNLYQNLPCSMHCKIYKNIHNVTIEPDGSFRLCLRIRGTETPRENWKQLINSRGEIQSIFWEKLEVDYEKYCLGCNWTCILMSEHYSDNIIDHVDEDEAEDEIEQARRLT